MHTDIFTTIEESFEQTKTGEAFTGVKKDDIKWVGKYMDKFYEYASTCKTHIAEIGVNKVCSAWAWAKARPKKITLCDVKLHERGGRYLESYKKLCSEENIELVLENKSSLDMELEDVDMLFIDGLHKYDHITKELSKFSPHVKKYIAFHDINFIPDCNRAAHDFLTVNKSWEKSYQSPPEDKPGILIIERVNNE